jgi:DNA-binding transcriptional LysR family regulator
MDLNAVYLFTRVVQAGSFTQAARVLHLPKSTVSAKIQRLENELGVTLLNRTTRKLSLTTAGERIFEASVGALAEIRAAEADVAEEHAKPQGLLRVTAPVEMGTSVLPGVISAFVRRYPSIQMDLVLTDRVVDLVGEGIDLGIRAGNLEDSSLIARRIGASTFQCYASPGYLRSHPAPRAPQDLASHRCIQFTTLADAGAWTLRSGKRKARVSVRGGVRANNLSAIHAFALDGHGIGLMPRFLCMGDLASGRLVRVLDGWDSEQEPVHAVYPRQRFVPPRLRLFIEFLLEPSTTQLREDE